MMDGNCNAAQYELFLTTVVREKHASHGTALDYESSGQSQFQYLQVDSVEWMSQRVLVLVPSPSSVPSAQTPCESETKQTHRYRK